jgi:hypothetical protein
MVLFLDRSSGAAFRKTDTVMIKREMSSNKSDFTEAPAAITATKLLSTS